MNPGPKSKGKALKMAVLSVRFLVYLAILASTTGKSNGKERPLPRIGVIGGGISGSTSCYYLRQHWGKAQIDLLNDGEIGGRIATVTIGGEQYESGATVIHPRNMYMVNFTKMFGLRKRDGVSGKLGLYDGKEMVFTGGDSGMWTAAKLLWHYGRSIIYIERYIQDILKLFDRIYAEQDAGHAFTTIDRLLAAMSPKFVDASKESIKDHLTKRFYSEEFIDKLVMAGMRVNYGQTNDIHAFVGLISLAGIQQGLWSVHGGNKLVADALTQAAKVNLLKAKVIQVSRTPEGQYSVLYRDPSDKVSSKLYDILILATPVETSGIQFENFPKPLLPLTGRFHQTVATFVDGKINTKKFGFNSEAEFTEALLTTNPELFFNSIGKQQPVDFTLSDKTEAKTVWKVFSQDRLTEAQISELFTERTEVKVVNWQAYPHYTSQDTETKLPPLKLYANFYYSSAIEWAASAVEVAVIGGRNSALLAINEWDGQFDRIDRPSKTKNKEVKAEL